METTIFTLSWTFSKESIKDFAIFKWWTEKVLVESEIKNGESLEIVHIEQDNPITFEHFVKDYFIDVISDEISQLQRNKTIQDIISDAELKAKETESKIKDNIKQGLSITIE